MSQTVRRMLLQMQVQGVWFALDAGCVQEILGKRLWVAIPGASPATPGVLEWRGRAVAVLDVPALAEGAKRLERQTQRARIIVAQIGKCTLALPVDAVREIREVSEEVLRPRHATNHPYASTEVDLDGVPMPLLDLSLVTNGILGGQPHA